MVLGTFALSFDLEVDAAPATVRDWSVRSVLGDPSSDPEGPALTVLEQGPQRYASRYEVGRVRQLRVVEWTGTDHVEGAVVHSVNERVRLSARYNADVAGVRRGSRLAVRYGLETPILGVALSFRLARRRSMARRLAEAWIRPTNRTDWSTLTIRPSGNVPPRVRES